MGPIICDSPEAVAERAAADFVKLAQECVRASGRFRIALSGGATPKGLYARLAQEPFRSEVPWKKTWIFWGDEHCVPPDHPESNFRLAQQTLLENIPVEPSQVFRIRGEDPPMEAARNYENQMREVFGGTESWPVFDLILLGLGPDGHTASLIPQTAALSVEDRWVTENVVRSLQTIRITFTFPTIEHAAHIWFLATGAKKADIFRKIQKGPNPDFPASLISPVKGDLRWYVDQAVVT